MDNVSSLCSFVFICMDNVSEVDRLLGTFETSYGNIHLVNTMPWDGAPNGRVDSILLDTEPKNKSRVRDVKPL